MRKAILLMFVALSVLSVKAQQITLVNDTVYMDLEGCLAYAFGNNYNRQSQKLNEESATDLYEQSKMERWPSLSASASESLSHQKGSSANWGGSYGLNASVTLYQGGRIGNTIERNKLSSEQTAYQSKQFDNELTIQILQAFLSVIGNEELLRLQESLLKASEEQARDGKVRYEARAILESDYLLLQAQLASDRKDILESRISRDNSLMTLKSLLSIDPQQAFEIILPSDDAISRMNILPSEDSYLDLAMETMPDLQIQKYAVEIAKTGLAISKAGYYPTISMSAGIGTGHTNFDNYGNQLSDRLNEQIGVTLSIPIFDNKRTKSNVNQSKFALQQAEYSQKQTELSVRQTLLQEYRNVISAESTYQAAIVKQEAYLKSFEAYKVKFREGAITPVELIQQQNNYISAMNEYIQDKYGFMLQRKVLDVYMGKEISM